MNEDSRRYADEVLADRPSAYFRLGPESEWRETDWPEGQRFTYLVSEPVIEGGDILAVVVNLDRKRATVESAYVNGHRVSNDHPHVVTFMGQYKYPRRWVGMGDSLLIEYQSFGSHAVYGRALSAERIAELHAAYRALVTRRAEVMTADLATAPTRPRFVVWHRKERGPVSPTFATRDEARRYLGEVYGGRSGLEVRRVAS